MYLKKSFKIFELYLKYEALNGDTGTLFETLNFNTGNNLKYKRLHVLVFYFTAYNFL